MSVNLLYHDVTDVDDASGFSGPEAARYKLTTSEFARHLDQIEAIATSPPRVNALLPPTGNDWTITFDDGGASSLGIADALERRHWRG